MIGGSFAVLLDEVEKGTVVGIVDILCLGLIQGSEGILMPTHLIDLDVLIVIDAELELALDNIVLHLAGNDGVFACLELIPHVHLPP